MTKERLEKLVNKMYYSYLDREEAEELIDYYKKMEQENKQLKDKIEKLKDYGEAVGERRNQLYDKIDKAIEHIKFEWQEIIGNKNYSNHLWTIDGLVIKELLEILGDKENE